MPESEEAKQPDQLKMKKIKFDILRRGKDTEEKYGLEKTTSFRWHETKSVIKNLALWKIPERGVITIEDVKIAIYQLEKDGLIEVINRENVRLTRKGSEVAQKLRTMRFEDVPDQLMGIQPQGVQTILCSNCKIQNELDSIFCKRCGTKISHDEEFCTYCGASMEPGAKICSKCGNHL